MPTMADALWKINKELRTNAIVNLQTDGANERKTVRMSDIFGYTAIASDDPVSMLMALSFYVMRPRGYATQLRNVIEQHDLRDGNKTVVMVFFFVWHCVHAKFTESNRR